MASSCEEKCFLWDIDGTLLDARELWEEAMRKSYREKADVELTPEELKGLFGPPALEGPKAVLEKHALYTREKAQEIVEGEIKEMLGLLQERSISDKILPGVVDCLEYLQGSAVGCVTGNLENVAEALLQSSGLRGYFNVLACAKLDTIRRADIITSALEKFKQEGRSFPAKNIYVIGDSSLDVRAAKELGLVSVAVATGHCSKEELAQTAPDFLLDDLREYKRFC